MSTAWPDSTPVAGGGHGQAGRAPGRRAAATPRSRTMRRRPVATRHRPLPAESVAAWLLVTLLAACGAPPPAPRVPTAPATATATAIPMPVYFDGERALAHAERQVAFGPRPTGSQALAETRAYFGAELARYGWAVEDQAFVHKGVSVHNIVARKGLGRGPVVILGAHYDTRRRADQDPVDKSQPVMGANDAASGAAVLLELARSLDMQSVPHEIWLAFFDAEDNGELDGWDWAVGSTYMAEHLAITPALVVVVDMVGDRNQELYLEMNSTPDMRDAIWATAAKLGYGSRFIARPKWPIIDDHTPFLRRGIPAVDIIDFDYPYYHTGGDTLDKISAASLETVGRTLETYLELSSVQGPAYP